MKLDIHFYNIRSVCELFSIAISYLRMMNHKIKIILQRYRRGRRYSFSLWNLSQNSSKRMLDELSQRITNHNMANTHRRVRGALMFTRYQDITVNPHLRTRATKIIVTYISFPIVGFIIYSLFGLSFYSCYKLDLWT